MIANQDVEDPFTIILYLMFNGSRKVVLKPVENVTFIIWHLLLHL